MAAKTDSGEEPMTKKVKVDFLQMIDDDVLTKMLSFGDLKAMVQFQQVSKRGRDLLHDDSPLLIEVMKYLCHPNKDDSVGFELHELWEKQEPHVPVTLEYLVFYKACRDKQKCRGRSSCRSSSSTPRASLVPNHGKVSSGQGQLGIVLGQPFEKQDSGWWNCFASLRTICNAMQLCHFIMASLMRMNISISTCTLGDANIGRISVFTTSTMQKSRETCFNCLLLLLSTSWITSQCICDTYCNYSTVPLKYFWAAVSAFLVQPSEMLK